MDIANCPGCLQRDAIIARLESRITELEATVAKQQQTIQRLEITLGRLTERLAQYEPEVRREAKPHNAGSGSPGVSYSVDAENKRRQRRRRRKKSPGRRPTELKFADANRVQHIYAQGIRH